MSKVNYRNYLFVIVALAFFACVREEMPEHGTMALSFSASEGIDPIDTKGLTKGSEYTGDAGANPLLSFVVMGYHTLDVWKNTGAGAKPNLMYNQYVSRTNKNVAWSYSPVAYWALAGYHTFFAYAPYNVTNITPSSQNSTGPPQLVYSIPAVVTEGSVANHIDLLYNKGGTALNRTYASHSSLPVDFSMGHALTKVTFEAKLGSGTHPLNVKIKSVRITDMWYEGTMSYVLNANQDAVTGVSWQQGDPLTKQRDFIVSIDGGGLKNQNLTATMTSLNADTEALFMIPQPISAGAGRSDGKIPKLYVTLLFSDGSEYTNVADLPNLTASWQPGQKIRYQIEHIGYTADPGNSIVVTITDWNDQAVDGSIAGAGAYYLNVSQTNITKDLSLPITIYYKTDYSGTVTASSTGGITLTHNQSAKSITFPASTLFGNFTITITAGDIKQEVTVNNIIAGSGLADMLYFDNNDRLMVGKWVDDNILQENVAFFQYGSVVGFTYASSSDNTFSTSFIRFNPMSTTPSSYTNIPYYNNSPTYNTTINGNRFRLSWTKADIAAIGGTTQQQNNNAWHTGANVKAGKGDPCRLAGLTAAEIKSMTEAQIESYDSGWRMPTSDDQNDFIAGPTAWYGGSATPPQLLNTGAKFWGSYNGKNGGWFPVPGNRENTTGRTVMNTNPEGFLPALGYRNASGTGADINTTGIVWSSFPYSSTQGHFFLFNQTYASPYSQNITYQHGFNIRCVRN